jgi:deoxyribodipyrimidine photo-lyase
MADPVILWFRRDLRLSDQAALTAAAGEGPVVPVYILDDDTPRHRKMGRASRWWLHHSLESLNAVLHEKGSRLILRRGSSAIELAKIARETGATRVHAIQHYEPWWRNAEKATGKALDLRLYDGNYLLSPGTLRTGGGGLYRIYTPFWRALNEHMPPPEPQPAPGRIDAPSRWPQSDKLSDWDLLPVKPDWAKAFSDDWTPGENVARERIADFLDEVPAYDHVRNLPSQDGTSRLSPHLHFGEVSPAYVWHRILKAGGEASTFLKEIAWRDFAQNLICEFPDYGRSNGRSAFDAMPWRDLREAGSDFLAWKQGRTGYPIVDAGMRQLWATGWMHNRVRMIAASFLIKHLLIDWRHGEQWFWDTLVDADYGNNATNWQWTAGSGVDANLFSRIMAPLVQSPRFEAGDYIRRWVPELSDVPGDAVHDPDAHDCRPSNYPSPLVMHREARERALSAYAMVKG